MRQSAIFNGAVFMICESVVVRDTSVGATDKHEVEQSLSSFVSANAAATITTLSEVLLDPEGEKTNVADALTAASRQMDLKSAAKLLAKQDLPGDLSNLVAKVNTGTFGEFSEESLAKARRALNELVEKAWIELDDKIFECKGFQEMNRENFGQTTRDIMRLIEQINDLERIEAESMDGIAGKEAEILETESVLEKEIKLYNIEYAENKADLVIKQNDLDVFQFILVFTKCPDATSLAQSGMKVCQTRDGRKTILFSDKDVASKYSKMLTATAKNTIDKILSAVENGVHTSLIQQAPPSANVATTPPPPPASPVKGADSLDVDMTCGPDPPDCALLHDKLSLMWGEFKDKVDELTMEMMKNEIEFEEIKENLNSQIKLLVKSKALFQQLLAEARSNMAADRTELKEKYTQKAELDTQYFAYMSICKKRIAWILAQDMCAIKTVRNAVLQNSTLCPSAFIQDCVMDAWIPEQCSVSCDNTCDPSQPFKCGGWQKMVRRPIAANDDCGIKCPLLEKFKRCGQYLCPIDCHMSAWSGWSKCTAECEGGLQSHTRSIQMKPKNGGAPCNTVEEARACNSQSCDRDCKLQKWTKWAPCSVACGGGFQEKVRHVLIPTRGEGKCPKPESAFRYSKQMCNTQDCNGDEICIAKQDLVIAVDGSGSLQASGFDILKEYVDRLLKQYVTEYFGEEAVKIGIVLFGNGVIMPDGKTVSPAISAQPLTFDKAAVEAAVKGLPFKKGFTNMAQAFAMAEDMYTKGSRPDAQQSVMIITDGKPSFSFTTNEMAEQLDDKGINRYFVIISETPMEDNSMANIKKWASKPWETNLVHIGGGLVMLDADKKLWAQKALTKFCPMSYSPTTAEYEESIFQFQHVKDGGYCGKLGGSLGSASDAQSCAALASGAGVTSFALGNSFNRGKCFQGMHVDAALYAEWMKNKVNPNCPEEGGWVVKTIWDFFAIAPPDESLQVSKL